MVRAFSPQQQRVLQTVRSNDGVMVQYGKFFKIVARDDTFLLHVKGQTARAFIKSGTFKQGAPLKQVGLYTPYDGTFYFQSHPWDREASP